MTTPSSAASNMRGIVAMIASQASFILNDALIKLATAELPGGQAIFLRGLAAFAVAFVAAVATGAFRVLPQRGDWPMIGWRKVGEIGSTFFYLTALFHMPIADATAILQFLPLAITASAALFLGERVGWRRWLATAVGLVGVMIVIRPGTQSFNAWSLLVVLSLSFSVLRDLSTRRIRAQIPTMLLVTISAGVVTLAALCLAPFETWVRPSGHSLAILAMAAIFLLGGYYFIIEAMRHGEVAVVSPFRYTVILWAIFAGIALFGEYPDRTALIGTSIVIAAGVYTFLRERRIALERTKR